MVLSAGVGNDVVGWILLALCVALVNSGAGITALWILLVAVGYALFLVFAVRPAFMWILKRTGSLQNGPTQSVVALTILMVLASALFTGIIGIHPIFGAFMVGLICPHEGGFAIKLTEKIEDLVSVLLLPLYFALSGLSTNLGLLDNGITWAYVVGVTSIAFIAKIVGGTLASWLNGLVFRESLTIGVLMSCKGLVELIVLNIGLQAKILSVRTFTIFVVMALVTTFATTPLTTLLYPKWYQEKLDLWKKGKIDWDGNLILPEDTSSDRSKHSDKLDRHNTVQKVLVYLRLDGLPALFTLITLMGDRTGSSAQTARKHHQFESSETQKYAQPVTSVRNLRKSLQVDGLRLLELTDRDSSVMAVSELEEYATRDPVVKAFCTFGKSNDVVVAGGVAVIPERSYVDTLLSRAGELSSDLVIIPWSDTGGMSEQSSLFMTRQTRDPLVNQQFTSFVSEAFKKATVTNVGVFIDRGILQLSDEQENANDFNRPTRTLTRTTTGISLHGNFAHQMPVRSTSHNGHHILVPFSGGQDDFFAVRLAVQLAKNETVTATIIRLQEHDSESSTPNRRVGNEDDVFFFDMMRANLPPSLSDRVVFDDHHLSESSIEGFKLVVDELQQAPGAKNRPEHIILVGRGYHTNNKAGSQPVLGSFNTAITDVLKETRFEASLFVVRAKVEGDDEDHGHDNTQKRQKSRVSLEMNVNAK